MTKPGHFITVEGQDGAGKSSNLAVIERALASNNIDYLITREPGGTALGESLRNLVLHGEEGGICDMAELLIIFAARAQHIEQLIQPALEIGKWVICDRFTDATFAYQGGGRQLPWSHIETLQKLVQSDLRPNLTLLFDVSVETGEQRSQNRGAADRFEREGHHFKRNVQAAYLRLAEAEPERIRVINANQPIDAVEQSVSNIVQDYINAWI